MSDKKQYKKQNIPKALKNRVWNERISDYEVEGKCVVCLNRVTKDNFECSHIISEVNGGPLILSNLTVMCSTCNKSVGDRNLDEFMKTFGIDQTEVKNNDIPPPKPPKPDKFKSISPHQVNDDDISLKNIITDFSNINLDKFKDINEEIKYLLLKRREIKFYKDGLKVRDIKSSDKIEYGYYDNRNKNLIIFDNGNEIIPFEHRDIFFPNNLQYEYESEKGKSWVNLKSDIGVIPNYSDYREKNMYNYVIERLNQIFASKDIFTIFRHKQKIMIKFGQYSKYEYISEYNFENNRIDYNDKSYNSLAEFFIDTIKENDKTPRYYSQSKHDTEYQHRLLNGIIYNCYIERNGKFLEIDDYYQKY